MRLTYRVEELAKMLGISMTKTYDLIKKGSIPSLKVDSVTLISVHSLEEWIKRKERNSIDGGHEDYTGGNGNFRAVNRDYMYKR